MTLKPHLFYGWWIVAAGLIIIACGNASHVFLQSQIFKIIKNDFQGGASELGLTSSILGLSGGIAILAIGPLIDRYGPRKLMLVGIAMAAIGFILLSFTDNIIALNIVLGALLGIGIKAGFLLPVQAATANWFLRKRSLAFAIIMTAFILGEAMITLSEETTRQLDWRTIFTWFGAGILVIGIPLAFFIRHRPEQYGKLPDGKTAASDGNVESASGGTNITIEANFTLRQALKTRTFWLLALASSLQLAIANMAKINPILFLPQGAGFDRNVITDIFQFIPLMGIAGILIFGYLGDRLPKRYLLAIAILIQSASSLIMMVAGNTLQLYLYVFIFGLGSGTIPLLLAIRADYFGRNRFATITVAAFFFSGLIGSPFSLFLPPLSGWIYDVSRSYELIYLSSIILGLIPAAIFFFARPPKPSPSTNMST